MKRTIAALTAVLIAGPVFAKTPLDRNPVVVNGFYQIGLADEIRRNCPSISPRIARAYSYLKSLERYAYGAGYSQADIEALRANDRAKNALRARIRTDLAARGATPGNAAGYCAVGRAEIANGSQAGKMLRAN